MSEPTAPLRIAIDVGPLYGHRTGVGVATDGLVRALGERTDVELHPFLLSFRSELRPGHRRLPLPGIVASHLWSRVHGPTVDRWARPAQLVHGTNYVVPPTRLPAVVSVYDCWFLRHPERASPVVRRAGARLRQAVDHGAWVHASSEATAASVRSLLGTDRVRTVHLGAPERVSSAGAAGTPPAAIDRAVVGAPFVVAVGTEEHRKDLARLVRAFAAVPVAELRLVLAGARSDASAEIDAAVDALAPDARSRVLRLGPVTDDEKRWLLRHAQALVYPSLDEGFGFPVLEGQLAGTPVIATDVGSVAEVGGEGVFLVPAGDTDALSGAIARAIDDRAARLATIAAGHRNLTRFDWHTTAAGLVELYRTALDEAPRRAAGPRTGGTA
jgi:glycosyltransferase involved in cell wall biosynthesis